jgi:hypothetical protein
MSVFVVRPSCRLPVTGWPSLCLQLFPDRLDLRYRPTPASRRLTKRSSAARYSYSDQTDEHTLERTCPPKSAVGIVLQVGVDRVGDAQALYRRGDEQGRLVFVSFPMAPMNSPSSKTTLSLATDRCYVVKPRNVDMQPSDLLGMNVADYATDRPDADIASALNWPTRCTSGCSRTVRRCPTDQPPPRPSATLNRWAALTRYIDDGELPIDNNWVENQIRPIATACS